MRFHRRHGGEWLVGMGFRCWLAGFDTCDISCWEAGWNVFAGELGSERAAHAVGGLACWVRAVRATACRRIDYYPFDCSRFCHDECLAISMISASQNHACPALKACAFALLGVSPVDAVVEQTTAFACTLDGIGVRLDGRTVVDAAGLTADAGRGRPH